MFVICFVATIAQVSAYVKTRHTDVHTSTCVYCVSVILRETDGGGVGRAREEENGLPEKQQ